jgi:hypothetical protein
MFPIPTDKQHLLLISTVQSLHPFHNLLNYTMKMEEAGFF